MGAQWFSSPAFLLHGLASSGKESLSSSTVWLQTWFVQEGQSTKSSILLLVHIFKSWCSVILTDAQIRFWSVGALTVLFPWPFDRAVFCLSDLLFNVLF